MSLLGRGVLTCALIALGCGDDDAAMTPDGGGDTTPCTADTDCSDGLYCTGEERCDPDDEGADPRGCVAGMPPCEDECDEGSESCGAGCVDADGDGVGDVACGGRDCDDSDPTRFPGNVEVCDPDDVDEDCDPTTFGVRDADGDGEPDANCCNGDNCGSDCDDTRSSVSPILPETCDTRDNDCDGMVDEMVQQMLYVDADGDGYGADDAVAMPGCFLGSGLAATNDDCDDTNPEIHPGAVELCTEGNVDENCDEIRDPPELCDCTPGADPPRNCLPAGSPCAAGTQQCVALPGGGGGWDECSVAPVAEVCNGIDDDCDGTPDDGPSFECALGATRDCLTDLGEAGEEECVTGCEWGPCAAPEACNGEDDDLDGDVDEDFDCVLGEVVTGCETACGTMGSGTCAPGCESVVECLRDSEVCNYCDDNGEFGVDDEYTEAGWDPTVPADHPMDSLGCVDFTATNDASCTRSATGIVMSENFSAQVGGLWLDEPVLVGYEDFSVEAQVNYGAGSNPGTGWAIVLGANLSRAPTSLGNDVGVPTNIDGFAFEHRFRGSSLGATNDVYILRDLNAEASDPIVMECTGPSGVDLDADESESNTFTLTYEPPNESRGIPHRLTISTTGFSCVADGDDGLPQLAPGTPLRVGFVARHIGGISDAGVSMNMTRVVVRMNGRCFPSDDPG